MSKTVDERIVQMKFDNAQFERNCRQSIGTIDEINSKVDSLSKNKSDAFGFLTKSANNVDMSAIEKGLEAVQKKFSVTGTIIDQVIRNLTTKITHGLAAPIQKVYSMIAQGGESRATNIANAKFQLKGLGVAWENIADDINYAVDGTAYGLDKAAMAASQLTASGVQLGEDMQKALRGISGVAAMTNSEYESISPIFTAIAGQGKVMALQLNQLALRGLNATATLGKALGKTEAEVKEMVKKGQIDFKTFSYAMDEAFGEHAKDANSTLMGVLSNIRAAMSRIGEGFYTPFFDPNSGFIQALGDLRLQIVQIKQALTDNGVYDTVYKTVSKLSELISFFANSGAIVTVATIAIKGFSKVIEGFGNIIEAVRKKVEQWQETLGFALWKDIRIGRLEHAQEVLGNIGRVLSNYAKPLKELLGLVWEVRNLFNIGFKINFDNRPLAALERFLGLRYIATDFNKRAESLTKTVERFKEKLSDLSENGLAMRIGKAGIKVHRILNNILDTFGAVFGTVSHILTNIGIGWRKAFGDMSDVTNNLFSGRLLDVIEFATEKIKIFFEYIEQHTRSMEGLTDVASSVFKLLGNIFKVLINLAKSVLTAFNETFGGVRGFFDFLYQKLSQSKVFGAFAETLKGIFTMILDFFDGLANGQTNWDAVTNGFKSFFEMIKDGKSPIEFLGNAIDKLVGTIKRLRFEWDLAHGKIGEVQKEFEPARGAVVRLSATMSETTERVDKFADVFGTIKEKAIELKEWFAQNGTKIIGVAALGLVIVKGLQILDLMVKAKKAAINMKLVIAGAIQAISNSLVGVLNGVHNVLDTFSNSMKKSVNSNMLLKMATSILIVAYSLKMVSEIESDDLIKAGIAIGAVFAALLSATIILGKMKLNDLMGVAATLLAMGGAILMVSKALTMLADSVAKDPSSFASALMSIFGLLSLLGGIVVGLGKVLKPEAMIGVAGVIMAFATAVSMLVSAVTILGLLPADVLEQGMNAILGIMIMLGTAMAAISVIAKQIAAGSKWFGPQMKAISVTMIALAGAIDLLIPAVVAFGTLGKFDMLAEGLIGIAAAMGVLAGGLAAMALIAKYIGKSSAYWQKNMLILSASLIGIALAIDLLVPAVLAFAALGKLDMLAEGLIGLVVSVGILTAALAVLAQVGGGGVNLIGVGAAFILLALSMQMLIPVITTMAGLGWDVVGSGILKLAAALGSMVLVMALVAPLAVPLLAVSIAVAALANGLAVLTSVFLKLSSSGTKGVQALKVFLLELGKIAPALAVQAANAFNAFMNVIIANIATTVIHILAELTKTIPAFIKFVVVVGESIFKAIKKLAPDFFNTVGTVIIGLMDFLIGFIPDLVDRGVQLIVAFIQGTADAIDKHHDEICQAVEDLVREVMTLIPDVILSLIAGVFEAGVEIFTGEEGFNGAISDFIHNIPERMGELIASITSGIASRVSELWEAGKNALKGFLDGFTNKSSDVEDAAEQVGKATVTSTQKALDEHSPSKEMYKVGEFAVQGLANGITDNANMVKTAMAGIGNMMTSEGMAYAIGLVNKSDAWKQSMQRISQLSEELKKYEKEIKETSDKQKEFKGTQNLLGDGFKDIAFDLDKVIAKFKEYKKAMEDAKKAGKDFEYYSAKQMAHNFKLQAQYLKQTQGKSLEEMEAEYKKNEQKIMKQSSYVTAHDKKAKKLEKEQKKAEKELKKIEKERKEAEKKAKSKKATEADKKKLAELQFKNLIAADKVQKGEKKIAKEQENLAKSQSKLSDLSQKSEWYKSDISALQEARDEQARLEQEYADKVAEIEAERQQQALMAIQAVQEEHDKIKDIIKSSISQLNNLMTGAKNQINLFNNSVTGTTKKLLASMEKQITTVTDWEQKLTNLSHMGVSSGLYNAIKELGPEAKEIDVFLRMTSAEITKANDLYKRTQDMTSANLLENMKRQRQMVNTWNDDIQKLFAKGASKSLLEQIVEAGPDDRAALDAILNMTDAAFREFNSLYSDNDSLADSLADNIQKAYIQAEAATGNFTNIGYQMCNGIIAGLQSGSPSVTEETVAIAKESYAAACRVLGIASPSKKFLEIGQYMMEGLAKGIHNTADVAINEESVVFDRLRDVVGSAVAFMIQMSDMASTDISPRVVPLMDTSGVMSGMQQLSGLIDDSYAYRTALSVNSKLEFTRRHEELMEELISSVNGLNNDDVINEMNSIVDRIDALDQSIASMQLVMDSGELVGAILPGVDQGLGRNIVYAERGMV